MPVPYLSAQLGPGVFWMNATCRLPTARALPSQQVDPGYRPDTVACYSNAHNAATRIYAPGRSWIFMRSTRSRRASTIKRGQHLRARRAAVQHGWQHLGDQESRHPDQVALRRQPATWPVQTSATPSRRWDAGKAWFGDLGTGGERTRGT
jgi:hypothetical protein